MTPQRLDTLEAGRALAAIAVMLFHAAGTMPMPQHFGVKPTGFFDAGGLGVEFFFVLSGYVVMAAHGRDIGRPGVVGPYLWRRFRRIYLPLWPVVGLMTLVYLALPGVGRGNETEPGTILSAFLLLPIAGQEVVMVAWTLRHEVIFYLLFALLLLRPRWGAAGLGVLAVAAIAAAAIGPTGMRAGVLANGINLLFLIGMAAARLQRRVMASAGPLVLGAGLSVIALAWAAHLHAPGSDELEIPVAMGLGAGLAILGAVACEQAGRLRVARPLVFLGQASYSIYLVHMAAISFLAKAMVALAPGTSWSPWPVFLALAAWGLACGVAFHLWVERPLLRRFPASPLPTRTLPTPELPRRQSDV